jgi:SAM-dependent methyltransferase
MAENYNSEYWSSVVRRFRGRPYEDLWRAYEKWVYQGLMERWIDPSRGGIALKTDLYDEAITSHGLMPLLEQKHESVIGADISVDVAREAKMKMDALGKPGHDAVVSDVRDLAFRSGSFDQITSNSTLDHFNRKEEIIKSIDEVFRVLKPGGLLLITMDNPANPVVLLRNLLPYRLLMRLGVIRFFVGVTVSKTELVRILESSGFRVDDSTAIVHSPRILGIWIGYLLDLLGSDRLKGYFQGFLKICERLERLPTRYFSGYFVAVKAVKI